MKDIEIEVIELDNKSRQLYGKVRYMMNQGLVTSTVWIDKHAKMRTYLNTIVPQLHDKIVPGDMLDIVWSRHAYMVVSREYFVNTKRMRYNLLCGDGLIEHTVELWDNIMYGEFE